MSASGNGSMQHQDMAAALFESVESDVSSRTLRMTNFPANWVPLSESQLAVKIRSLLQTFGALEQEPSATLSGASRKIVATATFKDAKSAAAAVKALHGVDNRTEAEKRKVGHAPAKDSEMFAVYLLAGSGESLPVSQDGGEAYDPEAGTGTDEGPVTLFCIDEIQLASGEPLPSDCEVFLRDLPLEDYTEPQLREWLRGFGNPDQIIFLRDPVSKQLTGKGYVRFKSHEEAAGLLAVLLEDEQKDDEEDGPGVQGTWSLSERLLQGKRGTLRADVCDAMQARLESIAESARCSRLLLVGGGRGSLPAGIAASCVGLEALSSSRGPLQFVASSCEDTALLKTKLTSMVEEAMRNPATFAGADEAVPSSASSTAEATPSSPCIVVKGFPWSWKEQQVRLVFALFGGVTAVHFAPNDIHGSRVAHVELKNRENMPKAVDQLHGTKVGDGELIEECCISCELFGMEDPSSSRPARRTLFLDEIPMLKRPDIKPEVEDREVFMSGLPIQDFTEDQLKGWLEGFGTIEEVSLLRDHDRKLNAKGYVRFASHREAESCIAAQASEQDAEEGDVIAWWSESERAARSAYGLNLHSALASNEGRVLGHILAGCEVREVFMQSKLWPPKDSSAPPLQGKQIHFVANCTAKQLQALRSALSAALQAFHERARGEKGAEEAQGGSSSSTSRAEGGQAKPAWSTPAGASWRLGAPEPARPTPAPPPPGTPPWQQSGRPPPPPWGFPSPYGKGGPSPYAAMAPGKGGPWGWGGPPPPPGYGPPGMPPPPPPPPGPPGPGGEGPPGSRKRRSRRHEEDPEKVRARAAEVTPDRALQELIVKGEQLVLRGKAIASEGKPTRAYEKFYQGLQYLTQANASLRDGSPAVADFRTKVQGYMDEAEKLNRSVEAPGGDAGDDMSLERRIERGEGLMQAGQRLARSGKLTQAYDQYCAGLKILLEVMPKLRQDDPNSSKMRSKISSYLEEAESLKDQRNKIQDGKDDDGKTRIKVRRRRRIPAPPAAAGGDRGGNSAADGAPPPPPPPPSRSRTRSGSPGREGDYRESAAYGGPLARSRSPPGRRHRGSFALRPAEDVSGNGGYRSRSRDYQDGDRPSSRPPPPPAPRERSWSRDYRGRSPQSPRRGTSRSPERREWGHPPWKGKSKGKSKGKGKGKSGDRDPPWSGQRDRQYSRRSRSRSRSRGWEQGRGRSPDRYADDDDDASTRAPLLRPKSAAKPSDGSRY
eukprot:TRINITY_DN5142_c0_g1_i1.p1 TRINITY_DN5142_c0_g1~~TRINITY_DN5142_c0_g1_i1.p1  ORF type:complete len:1225 (-),score=248.79 TRINITY_DN5142_c0_g1_i1:19-3693(-)